ncbi:MAG: hypothetical protein GF368_05195 [Candidatus Aenigmarchaeota archaeon]|nr:hypothetical protein [Candidatus Aenigmarchaeota archaeon]
MIIPFFTGLLLIFTIAILTYSYYNKPKDGLFAILILISFILIINQDWYASALSISLLIYSLLFAKETSYIQLATFSMIGSIVFGFFLFNYFTGNQLVHTTWVIIGTLILMCYLTIQGIFEDDLEKYLIISNFIQTLFVFLDLSVASVSGSIAKLGTIQIFNYTFAGSLLFLTLGILSKDNRRTKISQLRGSNYRNSLITFCASIAALSLSGVPGLNMFVSEWLLFQKAFLISPVITIFGIFLALLLFVMYFKLVYVLSVGDSKVKERSPVLLNIISVSLSIICILFGLLPNLQYLILGLVG